MGLMHAFSAPAVGEVYMRTVALCEQSGEKGDPYAEALHGLAQHHLSAARFDDAARVATVLLDHAREAGQPHPEVLAHRALSQVRFWTGRYTELWEHSARAMELYDPEAPVEQRFAMGIESGVIAMTYGAVGLWALGRPHEAAAMADRCVEHAKRQPDVYQQAYAQAYLSMLGIMLIDPERVERWALAAKSIAERHGFAPLEGLSRYTLAWAMAERGHPESYDGKRPSRGRAGSACAEPMCSGPKLRPSARLWTVSLQLLVASSVWPGTTSTGDHQTSRTSSSSAANWMRRASGMPSWTRTMTRCRRSGDSILARILSFRARQGLAMRSRSFMGRGCGKDCRSMGSSSKPS